MYPHLHVSGSPSSGYIYSGYEQYYSKDSWVTVPPSSWPTFYSRSSLLPETVNPKVTIHPSQPILVSDVDTPSSISSHSVLTPSSPFAQREVGEVGFQAMDFDEFDCDDEEDYIDSDFADEMEGIDEEPSPLYGASAPHVIKSTSALEGALGDTISSSYDTDLGVSAPADRRLSASVPGYPSASRRSTAAAHQRWVEKMHSPTSLMSSPSVPDVSHPSQHMYTQRNDSSSTSSFAPTSPSPYNHISSSSSLAGAFASSVPSPRSSRPASKPLPILQPQPIRPIPTIPLADLTSGANESCSPEPRARSASHPSRTLSPLPLLCQPVSDAVRYQLKKPPARGALDDVCYDEENASESMCEDLITATDSDRFAQRGLMFCQGHQSTGGPRSAEEKMYSCGCVNLPIRWQ
ncbi:hypothetical protein J3R83DRAFT_6215 [Lanmaoa asiatica]|nr:hypothetical protein J3R83DRAFT_6215 [Lanmaoa asiatica]